MSRHPIIAEDCARAVTQTAALWADVAGRRMFVTGGTGFFGTWFLELLTSAADAQGFDCEAVVLSRNPEAFAASRAGHLAAHRCIRMLKGDVRDFAFPAGPFDYVAHFGSTGPKAWHDSDPQGFYDLIVNGTRRVLDFAVEAGARRFLLASTGAVYGSPLPAEPVAEDYVGGVSAAKSPNADGKRKAEALTLEAARLHPKLGVAIARGFAFIGPYLPAEAGFAAYDFIQDAVAGRPIIIAGDGTPVRSYMYGADLAVWLWTLLLRAGGNTAWNVGAETPVTIRQLADSIGGAGREAVPVETKGKPDPSRPTNWYVPHTGKARGELGLRQTLTLNEAIGRTIHWYRER